MGRPTALVETLRKTGDLLQQPSVTVRVVERGIGQVLTTLRIGAREKGAPVASEHLADFDAATG
jgi:hypothetical protein